MDTRLQIVELCKERIATAKDKENPRIFLYDIIGALNMGEKNPLKICDKRHQLRKICHVGGKDEC